MNETQCKECQKQDVYENLMDIDAVAERLNISPHTVRGLVWKRKISVIKIGSRVLVRHQDLEDFIRANLVQSCNDEGTKS
jgi:excisionase family DNA binding protein